MCCILQGEEEKRGARITQGKPFLKRGPSGHGQGSFRRRSIRLSKRASEDRSSDGKAGGGGAGAGGAGGGGGGGERRRARDPETECK